MKNNGKSYLTEIPATVFKDLRPCLGQDLESEGLLGPSHA